MPPDYIDDLPDEDVPLASLDGFTEAEIVDYLRENTSILATACVEVAADDEDTWAAILENTTGVPSYTPRQLVAMVAALELFEREEFWSRFIPEAIRLGLPKADLL